MAVQLRYIDNANKKMRLFAIILMLFPITFCILEEQQQTNAVADEPETSFPRQVGNLNITSPMEQYMRDLYKEYAYESGKLRHGIDKPTDVLCFPDKGEFSSYVLLTYFPKCFISVATSLLLLHLSLHRCCSRKFPSEI